MKAHKRNSIAIVGGLFSMLVFGWVTCRSPRERNYYLEPGEIYSVGVEAPLMPKPERTTPSTRLPEGTEFELLERRRLHTGVVWYYVNTRMGVGWIEDVVLWGPSGIDAMRYP